MLDRSDLHDYQREAVSLIQQHSRLALWLPMGGGKTVASMTALSDLALLEDVFPVLALAPKRVAMETWPAEAQNWAHLKHLRVVYIGGSAKERKAALDTPADIYALSYDNLPWLRETLGDTWPFKTVVADEFTRLKSFRLRQGGKRAKALAQVAHTWCERFIGLTGTPSANGLTGLWGQTWFLDKGERLGRTFSAFEQRWFRKGYDGYSLVPYDHAQAEITKKLSDICFTIRGLTVDEPVVSPVYITLPKAARETYAEMEREFFAELEAGEIEAGNAAAKTQKLLQICNGAVYDAEGGWHGVHDEKLDALESIIEEAAGANVLVAYNFKHDVERIRKRFPKARVLADDTNAVKDWNAGKVPLLLAHPASAGHGLSLQHGGNILAFFGVNWDLELHQQIIERIGPMRQKQSGYDRPCLVYPILARNTVDEMVMERLRTKATIQELLLAAMEKRK
jgi:SNF2 family DNA or RNA helicase